MADQRSTYDGFISYSHAADDLLAPRLQSALQRFAKPWWKRRAVRIFRDESTLSANPHLWSSITEALDTSGWFVLLLSPDAARSEWVNQEIAYWVENRDSKKILPVVTDGEFGWDGSGVTGDAVPESLRGVFSEEPRWVDVRWAKGEEQLDLQDPRFADAVADIASTIRGIPKDDLASEEVRQHRRTVRTAWAAGGLVTILAIAAVGFGVQSSRNASEAERQSAIVRSRELAASAINVVERDPALAILLTLEAIDTVGEEDQPAEVINALWEAVAANRLEAVIDHGFGGAAMIDLSSEGSQILVTSEIGNVVRAHTTSDFALLWEWRLRAPNAKGVSEDTIGHVPRFSPDGSRVVVPVIEPDAFFATERDGAQPDQRPARLVVLDASDGTEIRSIEIPECSAVHGTAWSPDGGRLAIRNGWEPCPRNGSPSGWWVEVLDTETWERLAILDLPVDPPFLGPVPAYGPSGDLFVFGNQTAMMFDEQNELIRTYEDAFGPGDISPDGRLLVTNDPPAGRTTVTEVETGDRVTLLAPFEFPQIPEGLKFSSSGRYVIFGNSGSDTLVWDALSAEIAFRLPSGVAEWVQADDEAQLAYTGSLSDGSVRVWSLGPVDVGQTPIDDLGLTEFVNANTFVRSDRLGAFIGTDSLSGASFVRVFDLATGELVDSVPYPELPEHEPDLLGGRYRLLSMSGDRFIYPDAGWWTVYDVSDGSSVRLTGCDAEATADACVSTGDPLYVMARSLDGTQLVARQGASWAYFDGQDGALLSEEDLETPTNDVVTFTADWVMTHDRKSIDVVSRRDGSLLKSVPGVDIARWELSDSGRLAVFSDPVGIIVYDLETLEARTIELEVGETRALSIDPEEARLLIADPRVISVIDLTTDQIVQSIPYPAASDVHWLDSDAILVGSRGGEWARISLSVDDLVEDARSSLFRSFTSQECFTYRIDPCPTLEAIRGR
jgi:hypothetical protein